MYIKSVTLQPAFLTVFIMTTPKKGCPVLLLVWYRLFFIHNVNRNSSVGKGIGLCPPKYLNLNYFVTFWIKLIYDYNAIERQLHLSQRTGLQWSISFVRLPPSPGEVIWTVLYNVYILPWNRCCRVPSSWLPQDQVRDVTDVEAYL